MRLLVIEDEQALREQLQGQLNAEGFVVDAAADGEEGLYFAREYPCDLAIVDLGLPTMSGMEVIRELRKEGLSFPVLILTAMGRWQDKVEGLEAGADDYLVKPFQFEELLARVRALLRRASGWTQSTLTCGPLVLDLNRQEVAVNEQAVELTAFEYKLLEYFVMHAGEVLSKARLTDQLYAQDFERDSNTIEVFVGRLRKKLDPNGEIEPIQTVRGRGYKFTLQRDETA